MKLKLIDQFLNDVSECGLFFNNATRVYYECFMLLHENGYDVKMTTKGEPQLTFCQDKAIVALVDEAYEAAFVHIRSKADVERKLEEHAIRMKEQREEMERYYATNSTAFD